MGSAGNEVIVMLFVLVGISTNYSWFASGTTNNEVFCESSDEEFYIWNLYFHIQTCNVKIWNICSSINMQSDEKSNFRQNISHGHRKTCDTWRFLGNQESKAKNFW